MKCIQGKSWWCLYSLVGEQASKKSALFRIQVKTHLTMHHLSYVLQFKVKTSRFSKDNKYHQIYNCWKKSRLKLKTKSIPVPSFQFVRFQVPVIIICRPWNRRSPPSKSEGYHCGLSKRYPGAPKVVPQFEESKGSMWVAVLHYTGRHLKAFHVSVWRKLNKLDSHKLRKIRFYEALENPVPLQQKGTIDW